MKAQDSSGVLVGEDFLSLVSHEIKSPLTSITGFANFAEDAVRNNDQAGALDCLEIVRSEARRILKLAEDLLDASCVRAGKFTLKAETVDLPVLITAIVRRHATISGREIDFCAPALFPCISGDGRRLSQVIENLVSNAVKYSPASESVRVTLEVDEYSVRVSVWNGGAAIPADKLPMLFKRFSRVRSTESGNEVKGTGLGLYISKQIVEMHGGSITVRSSDEEGTSFTIELPREDHTN